jgi:lysophospholipase L1-like esterase
MLTVAFLTTSCRFSADAELAAFGDSVTWGYGNTPGGWVLKLEGRTGRPIANLGNPGELSGDGVERLKDALLLVPSASRVLLLHGGNNWVQAFRKGPCSQECWPEAVDDKYEQVGQDLRDMRRIIHDSGRTVTFATYWPSSPDACAMYSSDEFKRYQGHLARLNTEIIEVAAEGGDGIVRLDQLTEIATRGDNYFDCLHPNSDGYGLIARAWLESGLIK